ncbi:beta-glucosidase [Clostridium botulinum]|nr:beta-glucosidase [Clostridium botulinum]MBY6804357.1 beta-glucosidase [Clostridium botulinum]MBY6813320.1 beta-glucosidase [Clostridium botulinum]MBY6821946.1 beta-glucosidase [Clostridium botulinum]NFJ49926.1 beta-glucosidase [Clostridium botulinum]
MCEHKWIFQESVYNFEYGRGPSGQDHYKRIDTYYCEKCITTKEVTAKDEWSRERPYWWKNN